MSARYRLWAATFLATLAPHLAFAATLLSIKQDHGQETITLAPGAVTPNKVFILDDPDRLVVDVPAFGSGGLALPSNYKDGLITRLRTGRFSPNTTRLVFDLSEKVSVQDKEVRNDKLVIELASSGKEKNEKTDSDRGPSFGFLFGRNVEKPSTEPAKPGKDQVEEIKPKAADKTRKTVEEKSPPAPEKPQHTSKKTQDDKKTVPAKHEKPVVVIDAGHGGIDPGTAGTAGTVEKMMTLEYAQALRSKLQKSGHYQVVLTRDTDQFIMLRKRVEIARKAHGDLFISIHADSAPGEARGLSIYTVSEQASDDEAEKLAARENKADVLAGVNLTGERDDVAGILISLAERDTKNRSATLADMLVLALDDKVHLLPESHRFAGFAVLKAPDIPSVLIEIGFLSNPQEEKMIKSKAYRDKIISGITAGVDNYFKKERQAQE